MDEPLEPADRRAIAVACGLNPQYLYQCLTRRRDMDPRQAAALERRSAGRVRRWHVCRDWHLIWPELIGADGAPPIPDQHQGAEVRDAA